MSKKTKHIMTEIRIMVAKRGVGWKRQLSKVMVVFHILMIILVT